MSTPGSACRSRRPASGSTRCRSAIETIRALWSPGTKAHASDRVSLPETTCYPRPLSDVPIIVGGRGARTLRIAAELGDGCNVASDAATLDAQPRDAANHCADLGRDPDEVAVTVLDLPVTGADRDEVWSRVETLRGRTAAATFARTHHAGTYAEQRERYALLAERGVRTVFVAPPHVRAPADVRLAARSPMSSRRSCARLEVATPDVPTLDDRRRDRRVHRHRRTGRPPRRADDRVRARAALQRLDVHRPGRGAARHVPVRDDRLAGPGPVAGSEVRL